MKKLLLAFLLIISVSCSRIPETSYSGTWIYLSSDPDLGPVYRDSWFEVDANWNYHIHDAGTGRDYSGDKFDFSKEGRIVTLVLGEGEDARSYSASLLYLKDGLMKVRTDSVNGVMTEIHFLRED